MTWGDKIKGYLIKLEDPLELVLKIASIVIMENNASPSIP